MTTPVVTTARPAAEALAEVSQLIQETWGYASLRPLQREAIEAVLASRDCVVVLPTGAENRFVIKLRRYIWPSTGRDPWWSFLR